jgi:serine/threonine-protein kinase
MDLDSTQWPAFSQLIDRMLEQPPAQREDWVRALGGADVQLAPQLLELLRPTGHTRARDWLETLPKLWASDIGAGPGPDDLLEHAGDQIGPYRLLRLLGSGGMGSVWYAERSDQLMRRAVALKLPLSVPSRNLAARFERERDILAGLVHPNIARLYDAGVSAQGRAYLALEYVEGRDLDAYCDARGLGLAARVDLFAQVLGAVQYAHSCLVIHRDIKPSNILVTAEGQVRLLDFGVAKLLDGEHGQETAETELTRLGGAAMTLAYAAPEQIAGRPVSTATDVYSLGVVLYELLTGARPYRLQRATRGAMEEAILKADIALPSAVPMDERSGAQRSSAPARLQRELRGDLDAILLKALQREPAQRYATVAAFAEDLARYRGGLAVQAHRPSRSYQLRKFVVRNRLVVGSATAAALALLLGAGVALWQAREAQHQARIAATERDHALAAAGHREAVEEFLSDLLLDAGRTGAPISISTLIARADDLSQREFRDNPEVRAAVLKTVGEFESDFQGLEKALGDFEQAQALLAQSQSQDSGLRASVGCSRALLEGALGRAAAADRDLAAIIDDPRASAETLQECLADRAQLLLVRHDGPGAALAVRQALEQWQRSSRRSPMRRLALLNIEARARTLNGQPAKADAEFAQILGELKALGRDRGGVANLLREDRINFAIESGALQAALAQVEDAIAIQAQDVPDRPALLLIYDRSLALSDLGRYAEALAGFERVAQLSATRDQAIEQRAIFNAAAMRSKLGTALAAERDYRRAVELGPALAGQGTSGAMVQLLTRAKLDLDRGAFGAARRALDEAQRLEGVPAAALGPIYRFRALADLGSGDTAQALADARRAVIADERERGDQPYSAWVGQSQLALGQALLAQVDGVGGAQALEAAVDQLRHTVGDDHPALLQARRLRR